MMGTTSPRPAGPPASLLTTGFERSSTPWSLSVPAAEPPRTWPPSGPTRSRPWRALWRRCSLSAPPQPRPRPPQRHHPTQPTQPGQPSGQACCRWCRSEDRPSANSARRRRRPSSGGRSPGNGHPSGAGPNSAVELASGRSGNGRVRLCQRRLAPSASSLPARGPAGGGQLRGRLLRLYRGGPGVDHHPGHRHHQCRHPGPRQRVVPQAHSADPPATPSDAQAATTPAAPAAAPDLPTGIIDNAEVSSWS